ncbi:MAG: nucleotidyltransferase domain-containing protein [Candidatus Heimdallarchaeota archaeon]
MKAFNKAVEEEKAQKRVLAIFASGSFARGKVKPYSDIDLDVVLEKGRILPLERLEYRYVEGVLVGIRRVCHDELLQEFNTPLQWLWSKEGVQTIKIAYDPHNIIRELQAHVDAQRPTRTQFREAASLQVVKAIEYVHKLLNAHLQEDPLNLLYAAFIIQDKLAQAIFLMNEVAIRSENSFEEQLIEECKAYEGFYEDYLITKRILGPPDPKKVFRAAIRLFHQTCEFLRVEKVFLPPHLVTVEGAVELCKRYIEGDFRPTRPE